MEKIGYLDGWIISVLLHEGIYIFREVLRLPDVVMCFGRSGNILIHVIPILAVLCTNPTDTNLSALDLCHLLDIPFATGASISSFGRPMFQFALNMKNQYGSTERRHRSRTGSVEYESVVPWCLIVLT
jgi:hypothetical protein